MRSAWAGFYTMRMSIRRGLVRRPNERDSSAAMAPTARLRRSSQMRFMFIVKSAHSGPPTPELMEAMHKLADREIKAGRMLDNGGLMPLAMGAQVRVREFMQLHKDLMPGWEGVCELRAFAPGGP